MACGSSPRLGQDCTVPCVDLLLVCCCWLLPGGHRDPGALFCLVLNAGYLASWQRTAEGQLKKLQSLKTSRGKPVKSHLNFPCCLMDRKAKRELNSYQGEVFKGKNVLKCLRKTCCYELELVYLSAYPAYCTNNYLLSLYLVLLI